MNKLKVMIADGETEALADLGAALAGQYHVRIAREGHEALSMLRSFAPDLMVLDMLLPGLDGISLLQKTAELDLHPVVLATTRMLSDYMSQTLQKMGVDYVMVKPCDAAAVAARLSDLTQTLKLPLFTGPDVRTTISNMLLNLGIPTKLKGYGYLREAIRLFAANPEQSITKELYAEVASRCNATVTQVERSIRTAIETAWEHQDSQAWGRYFPREGGGRPSNGEFVARLADHLNTQRQDFSGD